LSSQFCIFLGQTDVSFDPSQTVILSGIENKQPHCRKPEINDETFYVKPAIPSSSAIGHKHEVKEETFTKKPLFGKF